MRLRWPRHRKDSGLNITLVFEEYTGSDPIGFVIGRHEGRRNLTKGQLAAIGEELATLKTGRPHNVEAASTLTKTRNAVASQLGIAARGMDYVRSAKQNGIPELIQSTKEGDVSPEKADRISRLPKTEQPAALARAKTKAKAKSKQSRRKPQPQTRPDPVNPFPSAEEMGVPINGTLAEKDAFYRKYGRTPLHPKAVKDMLNHSAIVEGYIMAILSVTNDTQPDALTFFASLEAMNKWVPHPEKGKDWGIDFARKAKKHQALLRERLPLLVQRANELQTMAGGSPEIPA